MKKPFCAMLTFSLALAIGLAATPRSARAADDKGDKDTSDAYRHLQKKYDKLKKKFDQEQADHIIAINKLKNTALKQISKVQASCAAKISKLTAPGPAASATATPDDQGTVATESASGVGILPASATPPSTSAPGATPTPQTVNQNI